MNRRVLGGLAVLLIAFAAGTFVRPSRVGAQSSGTIPAGACANCALKIASGATAMATGAITSATCATTVTATATGALTTDAAAVNFNANVTAVTGYAPVTTGGLQIFYWPTANTMNFAVCNPTSGSITPGAVTLNWEVLR